MRNPKEFWAGAIYLVFGVGALFLARDYKLGTAARMGPGFFPAILSVLLVVIGTISLARSFVRPGTPIGGFAVRGALLVTAATVIFGFLVRKAGLAVALPVLVLLGASASVRFRWPVTLALAAGLTVACVLIFVKGLSIPLPVLGPWFGR